MAQGKLIQINKIVFNKLLKTHKVLPPADYSKIKYVPPKTKFSSGCIFGEQTFFDKETFVPNAIIGDNCVFTSSSIVIESSVGDNCLMDGVLIKDSKLGDFNTIRRSILVNVEVGTQCRIKSCKIKGCIAGSSSILENIKAAGELFLRQGAILSDVAKLKSSNSIDIIYLHDSQDIVPRVPLQ